jgi:hypothetical protein
MESTETLEIMHATQPEQEKLQLEKPAHTFSNRDGAVIAQPVVSVTMNDELFKLLLPSLSSSEGTAYLHHTMIIRS